MSDAVDGERGAVARELEPLDPRHVQVERLTGWITTAVLGGLSLLALLVVLAVARRLPGALRLLLPVAWFLFVSGLAWFAQRWPAVEHAHTRYRVDAQGLEIHRGVVWRAVTTVPRSRVQHIDVTQGPVERRFGLGTLVVYTAGTEHSRVDLPGLAHETATRLRADLLPEGGGDAV